MLVYGLGGDKGHRPGDPDDVDAVGNELFHGAAHGYLLSQFLTPSANRRTDNYGGTPANRRRLLLEIVAEIRAAVGVSVLVSVKLNSADFHRGGMTEAESLDVALVRRLTDQEGQRLQQIVRRGSTSSVLRA